MGTCFSIGDKDRKAKPVVLGQRVMEIHLLDNNKQFSVTRRPAALCLADFVLTSHVLCLLFHQKPPNSPRFKQFIHL